MKAFPVIGILSSVPFIAWLPARFWTHCGNPWCLSVYPDWLDRRIYSLAHPYLAEDMSLAADQMEFLEVWIASVIIMQIFAASALYLLKDKFSDDD
jgi:hypothetical protein